MIRTIFQRLALMLFCIYLAILPGSTIVVALDRVPGWGEGMGGTLLLLQGAAALCWLLGSHGARGGWAALLVFLMAWAVEHAGVATGIPFGRYHYTSALQPQFFGTVPLAIPCAWLMVAAGAWQLAHDFRTITDEERTTNASTVALRPLSFVLRLLDQNKSNGKIAWVATLVLLLDLQIETVATKINHYWIWQDGGPYYGVPTANFVAWWLVGFVMALVVAMILERRAEREMNDRRSAMGVHLSVLVSHVSYRMPAYLYLLSTLMFAIVNLAHGYVVAGLLGVIVLLVVALATRPPSARQMLFPWQRSIVTRRRRDAEM